MDVLLNNAGIATRNNLPNYTITENGFEYYFGVNYLGTYALIGLLFDLLKNTNNSRIIMVSSLSHKQGKIEFEDLNKHQSKMKLYAKSKLAELLFTYELSRQIQNQNINIMSVAVHPGFARTNTEKAVFPYKQMEKLIAQTAEKGTLPLLYACTGSDVKTGDFLGPKGFFGIKGYPSRTHSSKSSYNENDAKKLWEISEDVTKVKFLF